MADGRCQVSLLGQQVQVPSHQEVREGDAVTVVVRPESLRLGAAVAGGSQELDGDQGRVVSAVFYGDHVEYEVETASGTLLCVESDPDVDAIHAEGSAVQVRIESSRAWALPYASLSE